MRTESKVEASGSTTDSWCLGGGKSPWNEPLPSAQWGLNNKGRHSLQPDSLLANHRHTWQLHSGARSQYKSFEINPTSCDLKQCAKSSQNWSPKWGGAAFKGDQTTGLALKGTKKEKNVPSLLMAKSGRLHPSRRRLRSLKGSTLHVLCRGLGEYVCVHVCASVPLAC